jgi:glycosyltransferase involved in cell wall biosynthesis
MPNSKPKIVIVGPAYPYRGGQALVEAYLNNTLTHLGYDCNTISYSLLYPSIFFPGTTQFDDSTFIPFEHKDKIKRIINSINPLTWYKAAREIKRINPEGVIFVWWMPFFGPALSTIARLIKRNKKTKIFFLVENYISHEKRWFDSFFTKHTLKYADAFICQSKYIHEQIKKDFLEKPTFQTTLSVYDCYDLHKYNKHSAREFLKIKSENVILFFGLIRPYKGLNKLIIAFKEFLKIHPDTVLLVVGECYEDIETYKQLIQQLSLEKSVILYNSFVPNEEIEPYFKSADVSCLPYNSGTQSGILMMSYGFKIPVVATNVGGISELILDKKTGIVIENNSIDNIVNGLNEIITNKNIVDYSSNINFFTQNLGYLGLETFIKNNLL